MIFKMMMDASSEDEKPVVRGFLKHLILGFAGGVTTRDSGKDDDDEPGPGGNAPEEAKPDQIIVRPKVRPVGALKPSKA